MSDPSRRRLHLHIGVPRTAANAFRMFLRSAEAPLAQRGLFCPFGASPHAGVSAALTGGALTPAQLAADLTGLADARPAPVSDIVLIDPQLCRQPDLSAFAALGDHFDLRVILAMRRQDLWLESWYKHLQRSQGDPDLAHLRFADFLAQRDRFFWLDYAGMLDRLDAQFGTDRIRPFVFDRAVMPAGPVAGLIGLIGVPGGMEGLPEPGYAGMSISPQLAGFLRDLPLDRAPPALRAEIEAAIPGIDRALRDAGLTRARLYLDPEARAAVMAPYQAGNDRVARRLGREALFPTPLPTPQPGTRQAYAQDDLSAEAAAVVTHFVAPLIAGLSEARDTVRPRPGADNRDYVTLMAEATAQPPAPPTRLPPRSPTEGPTLAPPRFRTLRTIGALVLREMGSVYGNSPGGYLWALVAPIGAITVLALAFSLVVRTPSLGTSFLLFYATGYLPFELFTQMTQKIGGALRFSRPLLAYPGVTWIDAILGRFVLNALTELVVFCLVIVVILLASDTHAVLRPGPVLVGLSMAAVQGLGMGMVNCLLMGYAPVWERFWTIASRPLFLASGVFFLYEGLPQAAQSVMWWNPVLHTTALVRSGFYPSYHASFVSPAYAFGVPLVLMALALVFLRQGHRALLEN